VSPSEASGADQVADVIGREGRAPSSLSALEGIRRPWAHHSRTFEALGYRFCLRSTAAGIGRYLDEAYAGCAAQGGATTGLELPSAASREDSVRYSLVHGLPGPRTHAVYVEDALGVDADDPAYVLGYLTWHINQQVIRRGSEERVLVHASGAVRDGVAVMFPAGQEAGKTTLVAGLVRAGYAYLTDEALAVDVDTLELLPYAKPLSIDPGSWSVLADLRPELAPETFTYLAGQWQVPVQHVRPDAVAGPAVCRMIVFPRYVADAPTTLDPLGRADALATLLQHCFRFHERGARNFEVLARLVAQSHCFRLTSGDLDAACDAVTTALATIAEADLPASQTR
jgi:hypothetical protein